MHQGSSAASAQAADDRLAPRQPAPGRRRRLGLAPVPESARAAREFTVATLHQWQLEPLTEDAVVIASELATNAIQHGTPTVMGDGTNGPGPARVELS